MTQQNVQRADALVAGSQLHTYIVLKVLGSGAFGITYLAEHIHFGSQHVIKEYLPDSGVRVQGLTIQAKSSSDQEIFNWGLNGFFNEAKLLYGLSHPNVVKVTDLFEANGTAYFVMPYLRGITLHQWIKEHPRPSENELASIFIPLLEGLKYIHERQLLHRDIKPENIFITENQTPVLIDFGAARQAVGQKSRPLTQILTPPFAPIEQYHSRDVFMPALDLYSIGACIYQSITHQLIEEAPARIAGEDTQPKLAGSRYEGRYSHHFLAAIDYALNVRAENRFQNAMDMQQALLGLAEIPSQAASLPEAGNTTQASYPTQTAVHGKVLPKQRKTAPAATSSKSKWLLWGSIVAAMLVVLVIAASVLMRDSDKNGEPASPPTASTAADTPVVLPPASQTQPEQPAENDSGKNDGTGISAAYLNEINKQLPQMISDGVRWDKTVYVESSNELIMQITMTDLHLRDLNNDQLNELQSAIGPAMAKTSCTDPNISPWLIQHNGTLIIAFYDKNGKHLVDGTVSGSDCP
ncbi:serine/threonine protein kinase [Eikenella sp. NML080894]|uniref:serine/threonine protein kinase n=1 Tax=Eikenella TaxID=538 RepID=UPI0007E2209F|nr:MULTISPECIES: serine/threonine-protein kinase [Eikenella]OAM36096.1 serine/threonine protein kinase [Eikenella sp. NML080894]OAM38076.1 serine/threonine protein kinase [Eikenella sp. NML120348]OAM45510.1 serine/threonine protein kinase [Eikenella sp. NML99-0057]